MGIRGHIKSFIVSLSLILVSLAGCPIDSALARPIVAAATPRVSPGHVARHQRTASKKGRHQTVSRSRSHRVTQYLGSKRRDVVVTSHRGRHHGRRHRRARTVARTRYAYPVNFFMVNAPEFDRSPLPAELSAKILSDFGKGIADPYPARSLVRAGLVSVHNMHGGIFWRREPVKYIIVHSTETGRVMDAQQVIDSWSSAGRRHAGAQYVVDRDGTILQAVDPDLGTVHVNIFKTLPGINNDNSIGIEMVHNGRQTYPPEQKRAVTRLVSYLQDRYKVSDENIITHRYAQQGDHTDPVAFDWEGFLQEKSHFRSQAIAERMSKITEEIAKLAPESGLQPSIYMMIHGKLKSESGQQSPGATALTQQAPAAAQAATSELSALRKYRSQLSSGQSPSPDVASANKQAQPALRGPIEMDPQTASLLNSVKTGTGSQSPAGQGL